MSIRSEIETKLLTYAAAQTPPIPVAIEGAEFTKPTEGRYLEVFLLDQARNSRSVSADGIRVYGLFQINCYAPVGRGMKEIEALRDSIYELYPVVPKMNLVSIEAPLSATSAYERDGFVCIHVTGRYRVEL